jgi:CrcB protein
MRYVLGGLMAERWGGSFPLHTMVINLSGSFLIGVLMALSVERGLVSPELRLLLGVGLLGGFTTFSTLSYETVALFEQGLGVQGAVNMFGSAVLGIVAALAGLMVGRSV